jgi:SAM-dependent methyltransferase
MNGEYTRMAKYYDQIMLDGHYYNYTAITTTIMEAITGCGGDPAVLEIGSGTGLILERLATHRPELRLTGVDLTPAMLAIAAKRLQPYPQITLQQQNVVTLQLERQYDLAFSYGGAWYFVAGDDGSASSLISHIRDPHENQLGLERLAAHLPSGASLLLGVQAPHTDYSRPISGDLLYTQHIRAIPDGFEKSYQLTRAGWPVMEQTTRYLTYPAEEAITLLDKCGFDAHANAAPGSLFKEFRKR